MPKVFFKTVRNLGELNTVLGLYHCLTNAIIVLLRNTGLAEEEMLIEKQNS
jgi:hypothetical protein